MERVDIGRKPGITENISAKEAVFNGSMHADHADPSMDASLSGSIRQTGRRGAICMIAASTIAGTRHVAGISEIAEELSIGDTLGFRRDSGNFFDEWAVGVYDSKGRRLGYMSCEHNEIVSRLMDGGKRLFGRLIGKSRRDAWTKLDMKVMLDG